MSANFSKQVLRWYDQHGRKDLPWQRDYDPYKIWLAEIMLQQTQVTTVIPYFERFIDTLPTVNDLADATDDLVMHLWSGLGYYSRARNLHKAAKMVVEEFSGEFPQDIDKLQQLPGVGRSTAGSLYCTAFNKRAAILDGNVKRVLARHFAVEGWPGKPNVAEKLWSLSETVTPKKRSRDYNQAIMDLGALVCTRSKPGCDDCPIRSTCIAKKESRIEEFPQRKPKKAIPVRQTKLLMIQNHEGFLLLEKRPPAGIWGGLWSFPEQAHDQEPQVSHRVIEEKPSFRHTFSHFHLDITPVVAKPACQNTLSETPDRIWFDPQKPLELGLAAPVSELLNRYF